MKKRLFFSILLILSFIVNINVSFGSSLLQNYASQEKVTTVQNYNTHHHSTQSVKKHCHNNSTAQEKVNKHCSTTHLNCDGNSSCDDCLIHCSLTLTSFNFIIFTPTPAHLFSTLKTYYTPSLSYSFLRPPTHS